MKWNATIKMVWLQINIPGIIILRRQNYSIKKLFHIFRNWTYLLWRRSGAIMAINLANAWENIALECRDFFFLLTKYEIITLVHFCHFHAIQVHLTTIELKRHLINATCMHGYIQMTARVRTKIVFVSSFTRKTEKTVSVLTKICIISTQTL